MVGERGQHLVAQGHMGVLRNVVDQNRDGRFVGHAAKVVDQRRHRQRRAVIARGPDQHGVRAFIGRCLGGEDGRAGGLSTRPGQ